jgi:hypothetical protein
MQIARSFLPAAPRAVRFPKQIIRQAGFYRMVHHALRVRCMSALYQFDDFYEEPFASPAEIDRKP